MISLGIQCETSFHTKHLQEYGKQNKEGSEKSLKKIGLIESMHIEFEDEVKHLKYVQECITRESDQLMKNLAELKQWKDENRKDELSERSDVDRIQTRMLDYGVNDSRYTETYERVLELGKMFYAPYFGKIVYFDKEFEDEESYYIGKRGLTQDMEPMILDWRTPVASLFYQQRLGEMSFQAPAGEIEVDLLNRRQFVIKNGEMTGMFDSAVDVQDDILQLMLSENSTDRLKEIVSTIQKEQDDIIRAPFEDNILLDGVAGSGKTTIILHRVAYLLFNYRNKLHNKILILGPNQIFMEYISQVLPDLGETEGTHQRTLKTLTRELLDLKGRIMETDRYFEQLLSEKEDIPGSFRATVYSRAGADYAMKLEDSLRRFEQAQRFRADLKFEKQCILSAAEGNDLFFKTWQSMPYNRRCMRIKRLINDRLRSYRDRRVQEIRMDFKNRITKANLAGDLPLSNALKDQLEKAVEDFILKVNAFRMELRQVYPKLEPENWYTAFLQEKPETQCSDEEAAGQEWMEEDLWAMLYAACKAEGGNLFEVRHLLVDEAQDVSALGLLTLMKLTGTESMTIVGDIRQKIKGQGYPSLMDTWQQLLTPSTLKKTKECKLAMSYRSTREIMEYAVAMLDEERKLKLRTIERPSAPVQFRDLSDCDLTKTEEQKQTIKVLQEAIDYLREEKMERIAILTENARQAQILAQLLPERTELVVNEKQRSSGGRIPILPVYFAKGLEYDGVIVADTMKDPLIHYVLCTRALHRLIHLKIQDEN